MKRFMYKNTTFRRLTPLFLFLLSAAPLLVFAADTSFVPLTSIPGFGEIGNAPSLPIFLNSLYKLCIGAAAVIAVVQIMRAGVSIMSNSGSFTANKDAKDLITSAVIGLVLVLSPYVVFSIINPSVRDLNLDVSGLQVPLGHVDTTATPSVLDTPEEAQKNDVRLDSHVCLDGSLSKKLQTNLDKARQTQKSGDLFLNIQSEGQSGVACCEAVKDVSGKSCSAGQSTSLGFGDVYSNQKTYTCTCHG